MFLKSILALTILATISLSAFANKLDSSNPWEVIYQTTENSKGSEGFEVLQTKYPAIFGNYDAQYVTSANISTRLYKFKGTHTCTPSDPRLLHEANGYGLCERDPNGNMGSCFQTAVSMPAPFDPCRN